MGQKMIYVLWILALGVSVPALGQTNTAQKSEIREYRSLKEVFQKLPIDLQPHKKLVETNPVLNDKLYKWFKENIEGHRLSIRQRDLVSLGESSSYSLTVAGDPPFTLGAGTYKTDDIECQLSSPLSSAEYRLLQKQGKMPETLPYEQYCTQQELKHQKVLSFLSTLKLPEKKGERVTRQGSKVNVTGTIKSISTAHDVLLIKQPAYVSIQVILSDVEVIQ